MNHATLFNTLNATHTLMTFQHRHHSSMCLCHKQTIPYLSNDKLCKMISICIHHRFPSHWVSSIFILEYPNFSDIIFFEHCQENILSSRPFYFEPFISNVFLLMLIDLLS